MERFDFSHAPFDSLDAGERQLLQKSVDIVFFAEEEPIIRPQAAIEHLYVVIKGVVKESGEDGEVAALYHVWDTFDARALMQGSTPNLFTAAEDTLLYRIPKAAVQTLIQSNSRFGAYCYASAAEKLSSLSAGRDEEQMAGLFTAKVRDAYRHGAVWLEEGATVLAAAQMMKTAKTKSLLVRHGKRVGLFTESAFRNIVIEGVSGSDAAHRWATFDLISIDIDDFVFHALLRMTQHKIQRVVVTENGEPVGALEQIDVLAYLSNHSHLVAQRLERADTLDDLAAIAAQMNESVRVLRKNGLGAPQLAQLMQVLNSSLFEKAWRLIAPEGLYAQSCLIVMGSEGRGEQILKTDQDNALIIREGADLQTAEAAAAQFSATLERFGYPPCAGRIMVNNPQWRKPAGEFKQTVSGWLRAASPEAMMNLAIFIDAKPVAGDSTLLDEVKAHLRSVMSKDAGMLMTFARAVEQFDSHSRGFFAQLLHRGREERMDVKKMGLFPVVHGVRALALEARLTETNTFERLKRLAQLGVMEDQLAQDVAESYRFLMEMRLKAGLATLNEGHVMQPNQLDIHSLSTLERDLLKESLQVVKRFKGFVRQHFHLNA
ncbi:DUF294 nucleotidyltransferase-like domain-containing protein [Neisseria leonii]|uniref:DUF294 nucleotidyltransferase-like domain-containing protein n=1 Tax=Neisseria leonii TaxID=2995413 RepID=A0A9X4DZQ1_9NEIS|nr:DUF294 nucleotidyltransferase-like domain-containing protein [Neisseria sp. 51.81]MDD9326823.1 DUF294 nucleotidyltransferase-like domain-containing protein [Neisseria sp. 51.81]